MVKEIEGLLPENFKLPKNYTKIVDQALADGHLAGKARSQFLSKVADMIHFHKHYPSREEYVRARGSDDC